MRYDLFKKSIITNKKEQKDKFDNI